MTAAVHPTPWPRLSVTLPHPPSPESCQACGQVEALGDLERWQECDEQDRSEPIIVVLCHACAKRLIKPHPRLYRRLWTFDPWPGCMPICTACTHRRGTGCRHPALKANGGPGLTMHVPQGVSMHLNYGGGRGEFRVVRDRWPERCAGRAVVPA